MKKTTITIAAALLAGSMGLGTLISQAAEVEYEDATNARTEGTVIILENDSSNPVIPDRSSLGSNSSQVTGIKLPTKNLSNSTGKCEEWVPFHDIFNSMMHMDSEMSEV